MRFNGKFGTTVFSKETNNNLYLHWKSLALMTWKNSTLRTIIRKVYTVC